LAARDSSPGGCRKLGSGAAIGRKACGDYAYRQILSPTRERVCSSWAICLG